MKTIRFGIISLSLLTAFSVAHADNVYKRINEQGVVEYSDQPQEGSEEIKVKSPQTVTMPKASDVFTDANNTDAQSPTDVYESITITQPANDSAFNSGSGSVSISSEPTPALQGDHSIQLIMDGTTFAANKAGSFNLTNVDRGTHQVQVNIIDGAGKVIKSSDPTTFTVHRQSAPRKTPRAN